MKLYLVRHGNALDKSVDAERPLSEEGRAQASKMAGFLAPLQIEAQAIWHSGKPRARETAEALAEAIESRTGLIGRDGLAPNDPVENIALELEAADSDLMVVGHMPFMGLLASWLLANRDASFVSFDEAAVACLERAGRGQWVLLWHVSPGVVR